jgi:hypothetical protein
MVLALIGKNHIIKIWGQVTSKVFIKNFYQVISIFIFLTVVISSVNVTAINNRTKQNRHNRNNTIIILPFTCDLTIHTVVVMENNGWYQISALVGNIGDLLSLGVSCTFFRDSNNNFSLDNDDECLGRDWVLFIKVGEYKTFTSELIPELNKNDTIIVYASSLCPERDESNNQYVSEFSQIKKQSYEKIFPLITTNNQLGE